jgi:hypothetical protein
MTKAPGLDRPGLIRLNARGPIKVHPLASSVLAPPLTGVKSHRTSGLPRVVVKNRASVSY